VRCGYHGLKFDAQGVCVEVPGMEAVPPRARVRSYPVAVRNRWVFVWMGDATRADTALLPDNHSCDDPQWLNIPGYLHYDTPYLLICDNLLDFSHLSYVHEKTLGGSAAIAQARAVIEKIERGLRVTRKVPGVPPPAHWAGWIGAHDFGDNPRFDRWFVYDFVLPGTLLMHSGGRPVGDAEGDMRRAVELHSCQTLTPETETTTHYFFQQSHRPVARRRDAHARHPPEPDRRLQRRPRHDHRAGAQHRARPVGADAAAGDGFGADPVPPAGGAGAGGRARRGLSASPFAARGPRRGGATAPAAGSRAARAPSIAGTRARSSSRCESPPPAPPA
jgi:hypothetical protein